MRERLDLPILCQGDDATSELVRAVRRRRRRPACSARSRSGRASTCPGRRCSWWSSTGCRSRVRTTRSPRRGRGTSRAHGGSGFMQVSATQASLRLAQGAGRLIRSADDRGVVAVLDSRLANARYADFIRASLPPMWPTTDGALVRASLAKIDAAAPPVLPVPERVGGGGASAVRRPAAGRAPTSRPARQALDRRRGRPARRRVRRGDAGAAAGRRAGPDPFGDRGRLKAQGLTARVRLARGVSCAEHGQGLAYALSRGAAAAARVRLTASPRRSRPTTGASSSTATRVRVTATPVGDPLDALVAVDSADPLLMGEASSRILVADA